jgi:sugar phosphate isomerase/epimerase
MLSCGLTTGGDPPGTGARMSGRLDRREFLARTAFGAAALSLQPRGPQPSAMFVSLPPWAVARNIGWPEQARLAARVGYRGIDWAFAPAKAAGVEATKALLAELGITPTITNLPMQNALGVDDAAFEAQLPKLAEDAAFCQAVGGRRFQLVLGATTVDGQSEVARGAVVQRRLAAIGGVLAKHDVVLGLEFLGPLMFRRARPRPGTAAPDPAAPPPPPPVPFVWTLPETLRLCEASAPNVGVTLDAWHWYHSGGTVADVRAAPAARIVHVHVSDAKPMPPEDVRDNMRHLPGEGVIDLVGFFQALQAIGYRGGIAPEVIGPRIPDDMPPEESAKLALEATSAVLRKAGIP